MALEFSTVSRELPSLVDRDLQAAKIIAKGPLGTYFYRQFNA
jgi:hypothetical protein